MIKYYVYLETADNLSDKKLALLFCQVVGGAGSPESKHANIYEGTGRTYLVTKSPPERYSVTSMDSL